MTTQNTNTTDIYTINLGDTMSCTPTTGTFSIQNTTGSYPYGINYNYPTISSGISTDTITIADYNNNWSNSIDVKGDANFEGDLKIKGKSLISSLEKIEEKLAILYPNEKLEAKWEQLRNLRKQYMELEKEIIEKEKVWEILNK